MNCPRCGGLLIDGEMFVLQQDGQSRTFCLKCVIQLANFAIQDRY